MGTDCLEKQCPGASLGRRLAQRLSIGQRLPFLGVPLDELPQSLGHADDLDHSPPQITISRKRRRQSMSLLRITRLEDSDKKQQRQIRISRTAEIRQQVPVDVRRKERRKLLAGQQAACQVEIRQPCPDQPAGVGVYASTHLAGASPPTRSDCRVRDRSQTSSPHARTAGRHTLMRSC